MVQTLKAQYEARQSLHERVIAADSTLLEAMSDARLIVEALDQATLDKATAIIKKLTAIKSEAPAMKQLGNAIDFGSPSNNYQLEENFAQTPEGRWLAENGVRYGFLLSYPAGKEPVTGYAYEPWHWRYIRTPDTPHIFPSSKSSSPIPPLDKKQ